MSRRLTASALIGRNARLSYPTLDDGDKRERGFRGDVSRLGFCATGVCLMLRTAWVPQGDLALPSP